MYPTRRWRHARSSRARAPLPADAVAFGLKGALVELLGAADVGLGDVVLACKLTGFSPMHVAVANSCKEMVDFLAGIHEAGVQKPPIEMVRMQTLASLLAKKDAKAGGGGKASKMAVRTTKPSVDGFVAGLTPLQLAAHLGNHDMFGHLLMRDTQLVWSWGPVSEFRIPLNGIDSTGAPRPPA